MHLNVHLIGFFLLLICKSAVDVLSTSHALVEVLAVSQSAAESSDKASWNVTNILNFPPKDKNQYQLIKLQNGLHVILICDENRQESNAVISVLAGLQNGPSEFPDLAHVLEHYVWAEKNCESSGLCGSQIPGILRAYSDTFSTSFLVRTFNENLSKSLEILVDKMHLDIVNSEIATNEYIAIIYENMQYLKSENEFSFVYRQIIGKTTQNSNPGMFDLHSVKNWNQEQKESLAEKLLKYYKRTYKSDSAIAVIHSPLSLEKQRKIASETLFKFPQREPESQVSLPLEPALENPSESRSSPESSQSKAWKIVAIGGSGDKDLISVRCQLNYRENLNAEASILFLFYLFDGLGNFGLQEYLRKYMGEQYVTTKIEDDRYWSSQFIVDFKQNTTSSPHKNSTALLISSIFYRYVSFLHQNAEYIVENLLPEYVEKSKISVEEFYKEDPADFRFMLSRAALLLAIQKRNLTDFFIHKRFDSITFQKNLEKIGKDCSVLYIDEQVSYDAEAQTEPLMNTKYIAKTFDLNDIENEQINAVITNNFQLRKPKTKFSLFDVPPNVYTLAAKTHLALKVVPIEVMKETSLSLVWAFSELAVDLVQELRIEVIKRIAMEALLEINSAFDYPSNKIEITGQKNEVKIHVSGIKKKSVYQHFKMLVVVTLKKVLTYDKSRLLRICRRAAALHYRLYFGNFLTEILQIASLWTNPGEFISKALLYKSLLNINEQQLLSALYDCLFESSFNYIAIGNIDEEETVKVILEIIHELKDIQPNSSRTFFAKDQFGREFDISSLSMYQLLEYNVELLDRKEILRSSYFPDESLQIRIEDILEGKKFDPNSEREQENPRNAQTVDSHKQFLKNNYVQIKQAVDHAKKNQYKISISNSKSAMRKTYTDLTRSASLESEKPHEVQQLTTTSIAPLENLHPTESKVHETILQESEAQSAELTKAETTTDQHLENNLKNTTLNAEITQTNNEDINSTELENHPVITSRYKHTVVPIYFSKSQTIENNKVLYDITINSRLLSPNGMLGLVFNAIAENEALFAFRALWPITYTPIKTTKLNSNSFSHRLYIESAEHPDDLEHYIVHFFMHLGRVLKRMTTAEFKRFTEITYLQNVRDKYSFPEIESWVESVLLSRNSVSDIFSHYDLPTDPELYLSYYKSYISPCSKTAKYLFKASSRASIIKKTSESHYDQSFESIKAEKDQGLKNKMDPPISEEFKIKLAKINGGVFQSPKDFCSKFNVPNEAVAEEITSTPISVPVME